MGNSFLFHLNANFPLSVSERSKGRTINEIHIASNFRWFGEATPALAQSRAGSVAPLALPLRDWSRGRYYASASDINARSPYLGTLSYVRLIRCIHLHIIHPPRRGSLSATCTQRYSMYEVQRAGLYLAHLLMDFPTAH